MYTFLEFGAYLKKAVWRIRTVLNRIPDFLNLNPARDRNPKALWRIRTVLIRTRIPIFFFAPRYQKM